MDWFQKKIKAEQVGANADGGHRAGFECIDACRIQPNGPKKVIGHVQLHCPCRDPKIEKDARQSASTASSIKRVTSVRTVSTQRTRKCIENLCVPICISGYYLRSLRHSFTSTLIDIAFNRNIG